MSAHCKILSHAAVALLILMLATHVIRMGMLSNVAAIAFLAPGLIIRPCSRVQPPQGGFSSPPAYGALSV